MSESKRQLIRSIFWLFVGGVIEFISVLLMIYAYLDYQVVYVNDNPIFTRYTDYTLPAIGFFLSLACIVVCIKKLGQANKKVENLFMGKKNKNSLFH